MRNESGRRGQAAGPARASGSPQPSTGASTRRERWARLRRSLWRAPRPHGEQPRERVVGPLELLDDLAVVVLVAQAARHLAGHLTWRGLGEFAVVFTLVWIAWANGSLHHELHGRDDARARSTFLLQILVLVAMAAFIPEAGGARGAAFAVAAGVLFAHTGRAVAAGRPRRPARIPPGRACCLSPGRLCAPSCSPAPPAWCARIPAWGLIDAAYLAFLSAVLPVATPGAFE